MASSVPDGCFNITGRYGYVAVVHIHRSDQGQNSEIFCFHCIIIIVCTAVTLVNIMAHALSNDLHTDLNYLDLISSSQGRRISLHTTDSFCYPL